MQRKEGAFTAETVWQVRRRAFKQEMVLLFLCPLQLRFPGTSDSCYMNVSVLCLAMVEAATHVQGVVAVSLTCTTIPFSFFFLIGVRLSLLVLRPLMAHIVPDPDDR
jgi:hypothetical protein